MSYTSEKKHTITAPLRQVGVRTPKKSIVCSLCEVDILKQHVYVAYPCKENHRFHLMCLHSYEEISDCLDVCPACEDPRAKKCHVNEKHICLMKSYEGVKRSLNVGRNIRDVLDDIRIDSLLSLANTKYKDKQKEYEALKNSDPSQTGGFFSLLNWRTKVVETEYQDIGYRGNVMSLIKAKENISVMVLKGISWRSLVQENINVNVLFGAGYNILDCFLLGASWDDLLASGLTSSTFIEFEKLVDITSLIHYYGLRFYQLYSDLCNYRMNEMANLGLKYDDFLAMEFSVEKLFKRRLGIVSITNSDLWNCLTVEQWDSLGIAKPETHKKMDAS